jgi:hypothetical protein
MNAPQPWSSPSEKPKKKRRRSYDQQSKAQTILARELTAKLAINLILTIAISASLLKLFPYYFSQKAKLQAVQAEIKDTQIRVNQLNQEFTHYFDPKQSESLLKKSSIKLEPNERRLFLIIKDKTE